MWKKVLIVLVLIGFAWSLPSVRGRVATAAAPALSVLGPFGSRMQEPMRRYQADTDLKFLVDQLKMANNEGRSLPTAGKPFTEWMSKRAGAGDRGRDPWGNYYWLERSQGGLLVGSNGRDGARATEDDLTRRGDL